MSDVKLTSLKSSSLQNSVNAVSSEHPFVYDMEKSTIPLANEMIKISPDSALQAGASVQTLTYRLPASGFLVDMYHKLDHNVGDDDTESKQSEAAEGLYSFENFTLTTRDVEIARFSPLGLHAELIKSRNEVDFRVAVNLPAVNSDTKHAANVAGRPNVYYTPLGGLSWVGARPSDSLDLQFLENVYLNARLRPCADVKHVADGNANEWTDASLHMKYVKMLESDYQDYLNANYDENKALTKMVWTHYPENPKPLSGVGNAGDYTITADINVPHYVVQTVIAVRDKTAGGASTTRAQGGKRKYLKIKDIKLSANGKNIVDTNDDFEGYRVALQKSDRDSAKFSQGSDFAYVPGGNYETQASANTMAVIDYRLLNRHPEEQSNAADSLDGGVSMGALSSKQITVKFETDVDAVTDVELLVVHKCINLISVDARNGSISVSTRS